MSDHEDKASFGIDQSIRKRQIKFERIVCFAVIGIFLLEMFIFFHVNSNMIRQNANVSDSLRRLDTKIQKLKIDLNECRNEKILESLQKAVTRQRRSSEKTEKSDLIYRTINFLFQNNIPHGCLNKSNVVCLPGKEGQVGPKGSKGLKGDQGISLPGIQGIPGLPGRRGIKGSKGRVGERGRKGEKASVGPIGMMGRTGPAGPQGPKGEKGDKGLSSRTFQKPIITNRPESLSVKANATARFVCEADGYPAPDLLWYINGNSLKEGDNRLYNVNGTSFVIENVTTKDEGTIRCVASSLLGKAEAVANLFLIMAPEIEIHPVISRYLTVEYGSDVEILCNATGHPAPQVTWQKLGADILTKKSTKSGQLVIKSVNEQDSGLYTCHAKNSVGHEQKHVLLVVKDPYKDCRHLYEEGFTANAIYVIKPDELPPFQVFCDMETSTGGWVVFQRRTNAELSFRRNWEEYKNGFGKVDKNFWLGLDKIHRLTKNPSSLRVDLGNRSSGYRPDKVYAKYYYFSVADEEDNYRLSVSSYQGYYAGDSLNYHNGMKFSTYDRDNDRHGSINCASERGGAWWHNACQYSALNADFPTEFSPKSSRFMTWYTRNNRFGDAKFSEMKLRRK